MSIDKAAAPAYYDFPALQAHFCGASRPWIYSMIARGELPAPTKIGGKALWPRSVIEKFDADTLARASDGVA